MIFHYHCATFCKLYHWGKFRERTRLGQLRCSRMWGFASPKFFFNVVRYRQWEFNDRELVAECACWNASVRFASFLWAIRTVIKRSSIWHHEELSSLSACLSFSLHPDCAISPRSIMSPLYAAHHMVSRIGRRRELHRGVFTATRRLTMVLSGSIDYRKTWRPAKFSIQKNCQKWGSFFFDWTVFCPSPSVWLQWFPQPWSLV